MKKIDYDKIFSISDPVSNRAFRGSIVDDSKAKPEISRAESKIDDFVPIYHFMGEANPKDVIWTANAHPLIFSETLINLLIQNNLTGWDTYPVEVYDKNKNLVKSNYYGFIITGRASFVDYTRSKIVIKKLGNKETPHIRGRYFYNDQWDGTDFFMEDADQENRFNMFRYCTERVYMLLKKYKIKNIYFENVIQSDIWYYTIENGASPRLKNILNKMLIKASN